ncbi:MAG: histidine phosphatase family protein [Pseudomonadota bacterium]
MTKRTQTGLNVATLLAASVIGLGTGSPTVAQEMSASVEAVGSGGRMTMVMPGSDADPNRMVREELTFQPWSVIEELARDDVVLLMRHGPTDWSKRDVANVAPTDCENQRVMTEAGKRQMYELGALLVANDLRPGRIVVSDWCRNQQTLEAMREGMTDADASALDDVEIETMSELNLLLSLQGAPDVDAMRQFMASWDGGDQDGPLLVISHFTNIQELTEQAVYEGEMLLIDPDQSNRVVGELKLGSAGPDVGHFE